MTENLFIGREDLIHYVIDLEALIRWLARPFEYEDPISGEMVRNTPVWPTEWIDPLGESHPMPEAIRLAATWEKVMGPE